MGGCVRHAGDEGESEEEDSSHEKTFPTNNSIMSGGAMIMGGCVRHAGDEGESEEDLFPKDTIATDGTGEIIHENEFAEESTLTVEIEGVSTQYFADASNEASMETVYYKTPQAVTGDEEQHSPDESATNTTEQHIDGQPVPDQQEVTNDEELVASPDKDQVPDEEEQVPDQQEVTNDEELVPDEDQVPDENQVPNEDQVPDENQVPNKDQVPDVDQVTNNEGQQLKPDESVTDTTDNVTGKKSPVPAGNNAKPEKPVTVKGPDSNLPPKKRKQQGIIHMVHGPDGEGGDGECSGEKKSQL